MDFLINNWEYILLVFMIAEKAIKASPSKYDDILLDIVWGGIKKLAGKSGK